MTGERDDALALRPPAGVAVRREGRRERSGGLARRARFRAASSLESADIGDIILIDDSGHVLSPNRLRTMRVMGSLKLGVLTSAVAIVPGALVGSALFGGITALGYLGLCLWLARPLTAIRRGVALVAAREYREAEQIFLGIENRHRSPRYQRIIDVYMAKVAWRLGKLDEAQMRYDRAIAAFGRERPGESGMYWLCAFDRAQLACARGDLERAVELRAGLEGAPRGEYFELERLYTDLLIAFCQGSSEAIEDDLYDAAKMAFQSNCFGRALVLLAWAFDDRGEREMAELALREAPSRLERDALQESIPQLYAWMVEHRALWKIAGDIDSAGSDGSDGGLQDDLDAELEARFEAELGV